MSEDVKAWAVILGAAVLCALYMVSRETLMGGLQISKTYRRKATEGVRNFWWLEQLHARCGLGLAYPINKTLTLLLPLCLLLSLFFWAERLRIVIAAVFTLEALMQAVFAGCACARRNRKRYGRSVVFLGQAENGGIDGLFFDICMVLLPLIIVRVLVWRGFGIL